MYGVEVVVQNVQCLCVGVQVVGQICVMVVGGVGGVGYVFGGNLVGVFVCGGCGKYLVLGVDV